MVRFENANRTLKVIELKGDYSILKNTLNSEYLVVFKLNNKDYWSWEQGYYNMSLDSARELFARKV